MTEKSAAIVTIKDASEMTEEGKKDIARWLRRQANFLVNHADQLASRYTARYIYNDE